MSRALINCKHIPGWIKPFLLDVAHGGNDVNSAGRAGISTVQVRNRIEKDPVFKQQYEEAVEQGAKRKIRRPY